MNRLSLVQHDCLIVFSLGQLLMLQNHYPCQIWISPIRRNSKPIKVFLFIYLFISIFPTCLPKGIMIISKFRFAIFFLYHQLNWKTMTIPSSINGHQQSVMLLITMSFHLQDDQCGYHHRIGRAIMKDIFW